MRLHTCSFCGDARGEYPLVIGNGQTLSGGPVAICQSCTEDVVNCFSDGIKRKYTLIGETLEEQKINAIRERKARRK